jgi:hypothetical protein
MQCSSLNCSNAMQQPEVKAASKQPEVKAGKSHELQLHHFHHSVLMNIANGAREHRNLTFRSQPQPEASASS